MFLAMARAIRSVGPPADFTALIRDDLALWKRTVEQLNITLQ
jgi:hypothetical protein